MRLSKVLSESGGSGRYLSTLATVGRCCRRVWLPPDSRHGLSCRKSAGRQSRHGQLNDIMLRAFQSIGVMAIRDPTGLSRSEYSWKTAGRSHYLFLGKGDAMWRGMWLALMSSQHLIYKERASLREQQLVWQRQTNSPSINISMTLSEFVPAAVETMGAWDPARLRIDCRTGKAHSGSKQGSRGWNAVS